VTGGTDRSRCRRLGSPQSSREVPAETQEEPAGTGRGTGDTAKGSGFGGSGDLGGGRREPEGSGLAAGGAGQGRGRPPPATRRHLGPGPLRHGRSGPGLSRPGTPIGRPPRTSTRRAPCIRQGQARCARPFATHDAGAAVRSGSSRARPSCWLASRAVLGRHIVMSSGVVKPARMSQVCRPAMVRSFRTSLRPLPATCWVGR
jgi:hypothetical protein